MALKAILKDLNDVPEAQRSLYKQEGDVFVLDLDSDSVREHPAARSLKNALDEEKEARRKASKKADDLAKEFEKYKDIDPERAREALKKLQDMEEKDLLDKGDIEKLIEQRTTGMKKDYESQIGRFKSALEEKDGELTKISTRLSEVLIDNALTAAATKSNVRKTALEDVLLRGKRIFKLDKDGSPVPMDGDRIIYGKDPNKPLSIDEWVGALQNDAPHLFEASGGGGAGGGKGGGGGGGGADVKKISRADMGLYINDIAEGKAVVVD